VRQKTDDPAPVAVVKAAGLGLGAVQPERRGELDVGEGIAVRRAIEPDLDR